MTCLKRKSGFFCFLTKTWQQPDKFVHLKELCQIDSEIFVKLLSDEIKDQHATPEEPETSDDLILS